LVKLEISESVTVIRGREGGRGGNPGSHRVLWKDEWKDVVMKVNARMEEMIYG